MQDNVIVLNSNETGSPTEDGGIEIERGTSTNASFKFDETNDYWAAHDGTNERKVSRTYSADIGNGADTQITVTHGLATEDVNVTVRYAGGHKTRGNRRLARD